jgi:DNA polymerase-1
MSDLSGIKVRLVEEYSDVEAFFSWLGQSRNVLAVDLETEGLDHWRMKIRTAQFGDADTGWVFDYNRWSGVVEEVARKYAGDFVGHNVTFDLKFMEVDGITFPLERVHDTQIQAHLINPDRRVGLKPLADKHISTVASHGEKMLKAFMKQSKTDWDTVPIDEPTYWGYGALDVIFTARLHELQMPYMASMAELYELERAVGFVLMRMTQKGMRVDLPYIEQQKRELERRLLEIRADVMDGWGITAIGSSQRIAEQLVADGWEPKEFTPTGKPKTSSEIFEKLDHPLAALKTEHNKVKTLVSTYLSKIEGLADDGVIHADIKQLGARTGRMSVARPSLQNLPRPEEGDSRSQIVRGAFIPREGMTMASIDYDQMELRIAADHADAHSLISAFATEPDMHHYMATMMFGHEATKAERQVSKAITFGKLFGSGVKKIGEGLGIPFIEAQQFVTAYNTAFPELEVYMKYLMDHGKRRHKDFGVAYVYTEFGRYQPTKPGTEYRLTNYRTQGTAADIVKQVLVDLDSAGFGPYLMLPIHDEVVAELPTPDAVSMLHEMERIMAQDDRKVPLTVGGNLGNRLSECK